MQDKNLLKLACMETQGQRIKRVRRQLNLTQRDLANAAGISPSAISEMERDNTKSIRPQHLFLIARAMRRNAEWLATGRGPELLGAANTEPGPDLVTTVPLISWVAAGQWEDIVDNYQPGEGEAMIPTTKKVGPRAFCVRVRGDSMLDPMGRRSYPDGSLIIVDPDVTIYNGAPAVVRLEDSEEATFKIYVEDTGRRYLKPLNPQYPTLPITRDATICGVVVQTVIDE